MGLAGPFERAAFPLRDQGILRGAADVRGGGGGGSGGRHGLPGER